MRTPINSTNLLMHFGTEKLSWQRLIHSPQMIPIYDCMFFFHFLVHLCQYRGCIASKIDLSRQTNYLVPRVKLIPHGKMTYYLNFTAVLQIKVRPVPTSKGSRMVHAPVSLNTSLEEPLIWKQEPSPNSSRSNNWYAFVSTHEVVPILQSRSTIASPVQRPLCRPLLRTMDPLLSLSSRRILTRACPLLWIFFCPRSPYSPLKVPSPLEVLTLSSRWLLP